MKQTVYLLQTDRLFHPNTWSVSPEQTMRFLIFLIGHSPHHREDFQHRASILLQYPECRQVRSRFQIGQGHNNLIVRVLIDMTDFRYSVSISHRDQAQAYLIQGIDIQPAARDYDRRPWGDGAVVPATQKVMYPGDDGEPPGRAY